MNKAVITIVLLTASLLAYAGMLQSSRDLLDRWGDAEREKAQGHARSAPRGAQPELLVRRGEIDEFGDPRFTDGFTFAGQTLRPGDTLRRAIEVLGPQGRNGHNGTRIWDALGITVQAQWPHGRDYNPADKDEDQPITWVYVHVNQHGPALLQDGDLPQQVFSGYLELDQVGIDGKTTVSDIRALADRRGLRGSHLYIYCKQGLAECYVGEVPGGTGIEVALDLIESSDAQSTLQGIMLNF